MTVAKSFQAISWQHGRAATTRCPRSDRSKAHQRKVLASPGDAARAAITAANWPKTAARNCCLSVAVANVPARNLPDAGRLRPGNQKGTKGVITKIIYRADE